MKTCISSTDHRTNIVQTCSRGSCSGDYQQHNNKNSPQRQPPPPRQREQDYSLYTTTNTRTRIFPYHPSMHHHHNFGCLYIFKDNHICVTKLLQMRRRNIYFFPCASTKVLEVLQSSFGSQCFRNQNCREVYLFYLYFISCLMLMY